jgi:tetratricopeptide (TPR) repeat protein
LLLLIFLHLLVKMESNTFRLQSQLLDVQEINNRQCELLQKIVEHTAISDAAKSLANRSEELEALRTAIRADLLAEKWEAALSLVDAMERRFGTGEEVEALRAEIVEFRTDAMRRKLDQANRIVEELMDRYEWDQALHEIERLQRALPDEPRVARIRTHLNERREARKQELLKLWHRAASREDVDEGIKILVELDNYLTREEAKSFEDSARNVFRAKLMQLGMQFQFAVREQRWRDALEIGVQIIEEFPNTRMSKEVSDAMDGLRRRAGVHSDVEITAAPRQTPGVS